MPGSAFKWDHGPGRPRCTKVVVWTQQPRGYSSEQNNSSNTLIRIPSEDHYKFHSRKIYIYHVNRYRDSSGREHRDNVGIPGCLVRRPGQGDRATQAQTET